MTVYVSMVTLANNHTHNNKCSSHMTAGCLCLVVGTVHLTVAPSDTAISVGGVLEDVSHECNNWPLNQSEERQY